MTTIFHKRHLVAFLLILFIVLLTINSVLTFRNSHTISHNNALKIETEKVKSATGVIIANIVHGADLAIRGFGLTKNDVLAEPLRLVMRDNDAIFNNLENLLRKQNYNRTQFLELKQSVEDYLTFSTYMIELARQDSMQRFVELLNEDRGFGVWKKYESFYVPLFEYEDNLNAAADRKYEDALSQNRIIQIFLMLTGIPSIIYILVKLNAERVEREKFISALSQSNRQYIFNDGSSMEVKDWKNVIDDTIKNFKYANEFITKISEGDYVTKWKGLDHSNEALNQANLAGNLLQMSAYLKQTKMEDERRNWVATGLTKVAELVRGQNDLQSLGDMIINNIARYTSSNQVSLFVVNDDNKEDAHLMLISCYAWDKKRYFEKTINPGDGLIGQCWYDGNPLFLTQVPPDYINITSGLGHATPRCIFIVPLKVNGIIYGVMELASFDPYQEYEREFIIKAGEIIAASISAIKAADHTRALLEQSQKQTELLQGGHTSAVFLRASTL